MKADLHMHSVYSDGTKTIEELVVLAKERGLTHIALTDHDSLEGVELISKLAKKEGIEVIKGFELSTYNLGESVHVLAYFLGDVPKSVMKFSQDQYLSRRKRANDMCDLIMKHFPFKMNKERLLEAKGMITRAHLANELRLSNEGISKEEVDMCVCDDSPAYIKSSKLSTIDGIKMLKEGNAIIILAHPTLLKKNDCEELLSLGFDGLEAIYPLNKDGDYERFLEIARKNHLMITAGSDYHGRIDHTHKDMATVYLTEKLFERY